MDGNFIRFLWNLIQVERSWFDHGSEPKLVESGDVPSL